MTIFNTVIPILMHSFTFSNFKLHNFAQHQSAASKVKPDVSQWKAALSNDVRFLWYTVANFWRYPIRRRFMFASALEYHVIVLTDIITVFLRYFLWYFLVNISYWPNSRRIYEPPRDRTNKVACAPSEDSDQPGHLPSLIRVFTVHMKKAWILSYPLSAQRRLWSDWADAQADLTLCWAHMPFCWFCHQVAHMWTVQLLDFATS